MHLHFASIFPGYESSRYLEKYRFLFLIIFIIYFFVLGTTHSVRAEEEDAYADWINTNLASDADVKHLVPISGKDLYQKITDGILIV